MACVAGLGRSGKGVQWSPECGGRGRLQGTVAGGGGAKGKGIQGLAGRGANGGQGGPSGPSQPEGRSSRRGLEGDASIGRA